MKITTIVVMARRWFDKANGNTYHSVRVSTADTSGAVTNTIHPFAYGYGEHFLQTAAEIVEAIPGGEVRCQRYANGGREGLVSACHRLGIALTVDVVDVPRRKDLHEGGRP